MVVEEGSSFIHLGPWMSSLGFLYVWTSCPPGRFLLKVSSDIVQTETVSGKWKLIGTKILITSDIYQEEGIQTDIVIQLNIK
jgi:hypothetical protein